jgi:hypothetical protein
MLSAFYDPSRNLHELNCIAGGTAREVPPLATGVLNEKPAGDQHRS